MSNKLDVKIDLDFSDLPGESKLSRKLLTNAQRSNNALDIKIRASDTEGYSWGILGDFLDAYDAGNTDTNALRWAFIATMATIKGRDCFVNFGGSPLYPNMYTLLVGDPGCGKSTAINAAKNLLEELGYPSKTPDIIDPNKLGYYFKREYKDQRINAMPIDDAATETQGAARDNFLKSFTTEENTLMSMQISDRFSGRQFTARSRLETLDHDALSVIAGEYTGTFPPGSKWFTSKALIDLYDAPDHNTYEISEGAVLDQPIMNLLGGVTPSGLAKSFETSDMYTGLLTRIMLVHSKHVEKRDPFEQKHDFEASTELLQNLDKIYDFKGEITISPEAKRIYGIISVQQMNTTYDVRLEFYYNRRSLHLTKVAMILALLNNRAEIQKSDMVTANTLLLYTEFDMPKCLSAFANTAQIKIRNAIIDYLEKNMQVKDGIHSEDIVTSVSSKLGINNDSMIVKQLQRLYDSGMIMILDISDGPNNYVLNKPRNTDVLEAVAAKVADIGAIPEWDIANYSNTDMTDPLEGFDFEL